MKLIFSLQIDIWKCLNNSTRIMENFTIFQVHRHPHDALLDVYIFSDTKFGQIHKRATKHFLNRGQLVSILGGQKLIESDKIL